MVIFIDPSPYMGLLTVPGPDMSLYCFAHRSLGICFSLVYPVSIYFSIYVSTVLPPVSMSFYWFGLPLSLYIHNVCYFTALSPVSIMAISMFQSPHIYLLFCCRSACMALSTALSQISIHSCGCCSEPSFDVNRQLESTAATEDGNVIRSS